MTLQGTPPARDHFVAGEEPAVFIYGYDGEAANIELWDLTRAKLLDTSTIRIPEAKNSACTLGAGAGMGGGKMPSGLYKVNLKVGGVIEQEAKFSVDNPSVPQPEK